MSRDRFTDTYDRFQAPERGRFGDNEQAPIRGNDSVRSDLVDVRVIYLCTSQSGKAIGVAPWSGYVGPPIYLPLSQIDYAPPEPTNGQQIEMTLPKWLAKEKGLI